MPRHRRAWAWVVLSSGLVTAALCGGEERAAEPVKAFRFGGGETVTVQLVSETKEQSLHQLVTLDGFVSAPGGGTVNILNLTLQDANKAIAASVKASRGIMDPQVSISINAIPARYVYVQGEVVRPSALELPPDRDLNLAGALAQAGGATPDGDVTQIKLVRDESHGERRAFIVDGSVFFAPGGGDQLGPVLKPGDTIVVPRAESFSIIGEVNRVGVYSRKDTRMLPGQPVRLSHAVAAAGGVKPLADKQLVRVMRTDPKGRRQIIICNLEAAMERGDLAQDVVLLDGDQVVVLASEGVLLLGKVNRPGIYYPVGGPLTLSRLLALAEGFGQGAKKSEVVVVHKDNPKQPVRVDMKEVMEKGRSDLDVPLTSGDMVFVGDSGF